MKPRGTLNRGAMLEIGNVVDHKYRLKREIARGGAGIVYEAEHLFTLRSVAIKVLTPDHARNDDSRERLLREGRALSIARHPGIVAALDAGQTADGGPFLIMELLEGRPLDGLLTVRGKLPIRDAVHIVQQLCVALAVAHDRGLIHRDIKPANVFITRDDDGTEVAKLLDFGVASLPAVDRKLTQDGSILGTPEYMAPEQLLAHTDIDLRCDIYSLGVTLYESLTGVVPFEGNFGEVLLKGSTQAIPPLRDRRSDVTPALVNVIEKALARDRTKRFANARALRDALLRAAPLGDHVASLLGRKRDVASTQQAAPVKPAAGLPAPSPVVPAVPRRKFARAPYVTQVGVRRHDGTRLDARSEDISAGGMLILPKVECQEEQIASVSFALPISGRIVEMRVVGRWLKSARTKQAMGIQFTTVLPDVLSEIERYVQLMGTEET